MNTNLKQAEECLSMYGETETEIMRLAQEAKSPGANRVNEIKQFAQKAGFTKIGIAHCVALNSEAKKLEELYSNFFEVTRVDCKICKIKSAEIFEGGKGVSCNPIWQAKVLEEAETELNVVLGLCLGHDLLFTKNSKAPSTTLIVKDRANKHNPIQALK